MRGKGITYDTGFLSAGTSTHEPFDPAVVRRELRIIRDELHCNAVRITGGDVHRLEVTADAAADAGLEVWISPFTNGLTIDALLELLGECAVFAERLRRGGREIVLLTGSEVRARMKDFLRRAVDVVRARFAGRVSYASLPHEGVDWTLFDFIATDAGYRTGPMAAYFRDQIRAFVAHGRSLGKPVAITEFGCASFHGSADAGGSELTMILASRGIVKVLDGESGIAVRRWEPKAAFDRLAAYYSQSAGDAR